MIGATGQRLILDGLTLGPRSGWDPTPKEEVTMADRDPNATPEEQARINEAFEAQLRDLERQREFVEEMRRRSE